MIIEDLMAEGISRISVKGFKSLAEECSVEVRSLTILAGANSSGKSSIMQPLLMMKQTLEAPYDPGALLLDGPNVRFSSAEQFLFRSPGSRSAKLTVALEFDSENSIRETFVNDPETGIQIAELTYRKNGAATILRQDMTQAEILAASRYSKAVNKPSESKIERHRCFLELKISWDEDRSTSIKTSFSSVYAKEILSLIHVPALRGNPERNYKKATVGPRFPGTFEIYAASVISHWQATNDSRMNDLNAALEFLGLTWKVSSKKIDDVSVEVMVGRLSRKAQNAPEDLVSIADVGFGISQTLPVIVALLAAEPGQMVYIEQPEIHLHPRAQMAMARILADAANRGVRVVAETHSSLLLLGIQSLVAEGKLSPEKVKLHWFQRRPDDGVTEVISADLDQAGAFGDWPEDFSSAEMDADLRYIHAAEAKLEPD